MSSEEQRLESKILYFEDMMFRCKGYEYQKVETIRKEILKDDKAEEIMKNHTMKCFDAMEHMGLDPFGKYSKD